MEQKPQPQLIIVPDEDYEYGIKHGEYPEFAEELRSGEVLVVSREAATAEYGITLPKENKIYVRNVFDGTYIDIVAGTTETNMIKAKAVAIREVLIMLGARSAKLEHSVKHIQDNDLRFGGTGKKGGISGNVEGHQNKHAEVNIDAIITLEPFPRTAKTAEEIRQFAFKHGLGNESTIIAWINRLERDHILKGPESIDVTFLEELAVARDAALNLKLVKCEAGFNIESLNKEVHRFTEKIYVDFGGNELHTDVVEQQLIPNNSNHYA